MTDTWLDTSNKIFLSDVSKFESRIVYIGPSFLNAPRVPEESSQAGNSVNAETLANAKSNAIRTWLSNAKLGYGYNIMLLSKVLNHLKLMAPTNSLLCNCLPVDDARALTLAVNLLKSGGVVAVPTDTLYGLACDAMNSVSIEKLYSIKCRNEEKPLAVCLGDVDDVRNWAIVDHLPPGLLQSLLPGPVTLILNSTSRLHKSLNCENKVGIRIPEYDFIRLLVRNLKHPIALTSANLSSEPSSVCVSEFKSLWTKVDGVFDGGDLSKFNPLRDGSTIIDLSTKGEYKIVRDGVACENSISILDKFHLIKSKRI